ncbi:hypothetical protein [Fictibacillus terranigra]|uniref:Uncharacterized protein n=1 Tax=Fictibacillus terranigra TaxID=3058424 RepID=A0ABT8ECL5_9BACL|nr:hypothetical protein [Fictibacillus sp. CENA-BCM004]MDN4075589.1 hypothetical protein [Fictibacillus sp. CENA-BCM004]
MPMKKAEMDRRHFCLLIIFAEKDAPLCTASPYALAAVKSIKNTPKERGIVRCTKYAHENEKCCMLTAVLNYWWPQKDIKVQTDSNTVFLLQLSNSIS